MYISMTYPLALIYGSIFNMPYYVLRILSILWRSAPNPLCSNQYIALVMYLDCYKRHSIKQLRSYGNDVPLTLLTQISSVHIWADTHCLIVGSEVCWVANATVHTWTHHCRKKTSEYACPFIQWHNHVSFQYYALFRQLIHHICRVLSG